MFKEIIKPALILFMICACIAAALAYVNGVTRPIIDESVKLEKLEGLSKVIPDADKFSDPQSNQQLKDKGIETTDRIGNLFEGKKNDELIGYVVEVSSKGYGGPINMLIGINLDQEIVGVIIASSNETPGLGSKASDKSFISQYFGLHEGEFRVVKGKAASDNYIQAISGATITSKAVTVGVNDAMTLVSSILGGAK